MCQRMYMNIKSVSPYGIKRSFLPCGKCQECRDVAHMSWNFRLRSQLEAEQKKGFWCGFVTLTYKPKCLPHIPTILVKKAFKKDYNKSKMPPAFSKKDIRGFIDGLRKFCYRDYRPNGFPLGVKNLTWLVGSEYGETTHRPHYHAIFSVPSCISPVDFFEKIKELWTPLGHVFPKDFEGGVDGSGYEHKPFLVDSLANSAYYASKYVCKDIAYFESINLEHFAKDFKNYRGDVVCKLRDYLPFHMQTRSLGLGYILDLSDEQKLEYLRNGVSLVGEQKLHALPLYMRNKILYDNKYEKDKDGKRLCRRYASKFFEEHYEELFEKRVDAVEEKLKTCLDWTSWLNQDIEEDDLRLAGVLAKRLEGISIRELSECIVAYCGCDPAYCYDIGSPSRFWLLRYQDRIQFEPEKPPLVDLNLLFNLEMLWSTFIKMENDATALAMAERLKDSREIQRTKELFNHKEY